MKLVDLYFTHVNPITPLLHRPSFERKIMQNVHLNNTSFGAVYLLVCAVAARYSDDPHVLLDGVEGGMSKHSAGWKYFQQVQLVRRTLLAPACLEDMQTYFVRDFVFVWFVRLYGHSCLFCSCMGRRPLKRAGRSLGSVFG